jgi:hypothetical protein
MQMHTYQTRNVTPPNLVISGTDVETVKNCKYLVL